MKICIIYFSGTGNTKLVAMTLRDSFISAGHKAEIRSVEDDGFSDGIGDFDIVGFGFPVYAWRAPKYFIERLANSLPQLDGKPAFIYNTRAIASWSANYFLARLLRKRGMTIISSANFTAPPNDWMVLFKKQNSLVQKYVLFDELFIEKIALFAENIIEQYKTSDGLSKNPLGIAISVLGNILGMSAFWLLAKIWRVDKDACTGCKICAKNCPSSNIKMSESSGRLLPVWEKSCVYCFRCINYCPEGAVLLSKLSRDKYRYRLNMKPK